jgi:hypothetical protein
MVSALHLRSAEHHLYADVLEKLRDRGVIGFDDATRQILTETTDKVLTSPRCDWYVIGGSHYVLVCEW